MFAFTDRMRPVSRLHVELAGASPISNSTRPSLALITRSSPSLDKRRVQDPFKFADRKNQNRFSSGCQTTSPSGCYRTKSLYRRDFSQLKTPAFSKSVGCEVQLSELDGMRRAQWRYGPSSHEIVFRQCRVLENLKCKGRIQAVRD